MPLTIGTKLGPLEILGPLGAGGMGEVYRALDTQLDREVAVKVLPYSMASDPERLARFDREAKILAALNHPNIAVIYGAEKFEGGRALIMELVPGDTLGARIKKGAMPVEETCKVAAQIAEALEAAHEKGVVHRDLKPGNVMITPTGLVKVLDFGLAAMASPVSHSGDPENSPTLTMGMTAAGTIMGTAAYMSPEQASGLPVDKRSDIWSYGVVLWEMLTGKRLFGGSTIAHTLADVLRAPIDVEALAAPAPLKNLIRRCLDREIRTRLRDIGEARVVIAEYLANPNSGTGSPAQAGGPPHKAPWIVAAVAGAIAVGALAWSFYPRPKPPQPEAMRFTIPPGKGSQLSTNRANGVSQAVSPDGRYVAFLGATTGSGTRSVWLRALGSQTSQQLDKTEGATDPFWSSDSKHIGFQADGKLKRIAVAGGAPINVADAGSIQGGTWLQQSGESGGVILFAPSQTSPILRVPASGGVPSPVTKLAQGESGHIHPQFLPDGKRFLYFAQGGSKPGIYVQTLGPEERAFLITTPGRASFVPPDYLLFMRDNTLLAQHVDWDALKPLGEPVAVTDEVRTAGNLGGNSFTASSTGLLAYRGGGGSQTQYRWLARDGKPEGTGLPAGDYGPIEVSPDNKRAVVERGGDLWLVELASGVLSRLTSDTGPENDPVWSLDSRRIGFGKFGDKPGIYQMLIGSGKDSLVYSGTLNLDAWTRDGLLVRSGGAVSLIPAPKEDAAGPVMEKPRTLLDVTYQVDQFRVSPDGKWVTYTSQESGASEVFVAAFPGFTDRRKISTGQSRSPMWRADGKELIYDAQPSMLTAVDVKTGATFESGAPKTLFKMPVGAESTSAFYYAMTNDAKRFLFRSSGDADGSEVEQLQLILNWPALLGK